MMESTNEESNADVSSVIGGRVSEMILVQRYRRLEFNVIAALCNAVQEPGETIFMSMSADLVNILSTLLLII